MQHIATSVDPLELTFPEEGFASFHLILEEMVGIRIHGYHAGMLP